MSIVPLEFSAIFKVEPSILTFSAFTPEAPAFVPVIARIIDGPPILDGLLVVWFVNSATYDFKRRVAKE
ncbi:MAG: hypothetical protein A3F74_03320 [Betaproteobacteria bacterium RIFCSPLOWO2_12_FULL_62_58]|nr:MAG: hypothetical protein A3F74_03320 [Betaproteobacteria bacterium RIFCSPLOWO2_12_FULL_62_58]